MIHSSVLITEVFWLLTLVSTLKVFTPSSTALSMSSIRLSVDPRMSIVEMAPSSFSVQTGMCITELRLLDVKHI